MSKTMTLVAGLSLAVAACGGVEPGLGNPGDPAQDKEGTVHRTIVWLQSDGTAEVKTVEISRAQQQAEVAQRQEMAQQQDSGSAIGTARQAVAEDPNCLGSSLWVFDDYNQTGQNELCLYWTSAGSLAWLSDYRVRYCDAYSCYFFTWEGRVRSYWAGVDGGAFFRHVAWDSENFQPWQRTDYAGPIVQDGVAVWFSH
jgi:hypothetical protein